MIYTVADLHGCYDEFIELLDEIKFNKDDTLYVIGDVIDRGSDNMKLLQYMMKYDNIKPLMGNHELMAMQVLPVMVGKDENQINEMMNNRIFSNNISLWYYNGGDKSAAQFSVLEKDEQQKIVDYIENFEMYVNICVGEQKYLLIHSLPADKDAYLHITDGTYTPMKLLFGRPEFDKPGMYTYDDLKIIIGHTPTPAIDWAESGKIYSCGSLIDIDCGCVSGHNLCIYRLDDGESFYKEKYNPEV